MKLSLTTFFIFSALTLLAYEVNTAASIGQSEVGCKKFADYNEYFGCLKCKEGYKKHDSFVTMYGTCVNKSCSRGCSTCDSATKCTACAPFYYLSNDKCERCSSECLTCTDSKTCTYCILEYFLKDSKCLACAYGCAVCDNT